MDLILTDKFLPPFEARFGSMLVEPGDGLAVCRTTLETVVQVEFISKPARDLEHRYVAVSSGVERKIEESFFLEVIHSLPSKLKNSGYLYAEMLDGESYFIKLRERDLETRLYLGNPRLLKDIDLTRFIEFIDGVLQRFS